MSSETGQPIDRLSHQIRKEFEANRRVLSFEEYLQTLVENPAQQLRSSTETLVDMMDYFGKEQKEPKIFRFKLFDLPIEGIANKVVGQNKVQTQIYNGLKSFARQKANNKLLLLHGPNGSAKTTMIRALMGGLERYSQTPEGATYTFNWIFPVDSVTKGSMGLQAYPQKTEEIASFAHLPDEQILARFPCDMKDHPFLAVPKDKRLQVLTELLGEKKAHNIYGQLSHYFSKGDLCHRCRLIFDALLASCDGDYAKVIRHIQVERYYYSRRYRKGLVTVEPQMHVDANYSQLTLTKSVGSLPASLLNLNFFTLSGDLVDGNRGIIEYSDLLKRPIDTYKYLLSACESGAINVGASIAHLDSVMIGSSNELQLDAFKEFPDFGSFKARIELIRVPYLLSVHEEEEIYSIQLENIAGEKHIAPHVSRCLALWATLTRLKKPNSINYPPNVSSVISNLTPIDKARIYDRGEMPVALSAEDRKLLRTNIPKLREEYDNIPFYEGRMGASVREIKNILYDAVQNPEFDCLSPLAVLREIEDFVKRVNEYEFLKQDVKEGYHDAAEFVNLVREEYLNEIDREVRESIGLYDSKQWEQFIQKYVTHVAQLLKGEKIQNTITGRPEDPDLSLIKEFEKISGAPKEEKDLNQFRQNIISQVGAWSLDHPGEDVAYAKVFPEYWAKLEKHYYESQKSELVKMHKSLLVRDTSEEDPTSEGSRLAAQTLTNMKGKKGYCDSCAREVINFLMRKRY